MPEAAHAESLPDVPPILSNVSGSFAWGVFHQRHPTLIKQIRDGFPYPPDQDNALIRIGQESSAGVISPLARHTHDHEMWDDWGRGHFGQRWIDVPFLWAESYFYRKLLDATAFFEPGPWAGIDPFEPFKNAELDDASLGTELAVLTPMRAAGYGRPCAPGASSYGRTPSTARRCRITTCQLISKRSSARYH